MVKTFSGFSPATKLRSEEVLTCNRYREGKRTPHSTHHEWLWITTLPIQVFPAPVVRRLGHDRWKQEDNGWMDLTKHWALKHGFLHACRHRPKQLDASGQRIEVPNRGLPAVTPILLIVFALSSNFVLRHSKLVRPYHLPAVSLPSPSHATLDLQSTTFDPSS